MPIDPRIPLSGVPMAPPPDYTAQMMQTVQLANLIKQSRMQQQLAPLQMQQAQAAAEMQQMQLEEAKRARAFQEADTAALSAAHREADGNLIKMPATKSWKLVSPRTSIAFQKEIDDMVGAHAKRTKEELDADSANDAAVLRDFQGITNA